MLARYQTETLDLLNDTDAQIYRDTQLARYINRSRRRIAYASGCLRVLPQGLKTQPGQEVYPFSDWISTVQSQNRGIESILVCRSLSIAFGAGSWKPMWVRLPFSDFQARARIFSGTWIGTITEPGYWTQFGAGENGRLYLAPIPVQLAIMEVDLSCIPSPLVTDDDAEPIPQPWQDAVPWWAAVMALIQQQRPEDAKTMAQMFASELPFCASVVMPTLLQSPYGATIRSA